MLQQCIDGQTPPSLSIGDLVEEGCFLRNLKKKHVSKRYEKDDDDEPQYGFKLSKKFWKDADNQRGRFSVNLSSCIRTTLCSIAIHPSNDEYYHVATMELAALNDSGLLSCPIVAQYQPVDRECNHCHFELLPRDGTVLTWMELGVLLDDPFPPGKFPNSQEECDQAAAGFQDFRLMFKVQRWVRSPNGELAD